MKQLCTRTEILMFGFVDKHQNWSAGALFCHSSRAWSKYVVFNSSGVSHSDGSCVLGRIHSDVSSNIPKKVYHIVTDNFVNLLHISYAWLYKTECWGRKFHAFSFNSHRNCKIFMTNFNFIFNTICVPYIAYSGSPFSDEIAIMIRHYVIHPHLKIRHYVIHPTNYTGEIGPSSPVLAQFWASTSCQIGRRLMLLRLAHFKRDFNLANTSGCLNWPT